MHAVKYVWHQVLRLNVEILYIHKVHFLGRYCNQLVIDTLNYAVLYPLFLPLSILLQNSTPMQCLLAHNTVANLDSSREESSSLTRKATWHKRLDLQYSLACREILPKNNEQS